MEKRDKYMTERRLDSGELNFSSLSKYRNAIYGLCAIWIVFFHGSETFHINDCEGIRMTLGLILRTGNCAVDVFMLLSGIGLYFSLSKKPKLSKNAIASQCFINEQLFNLLFLAFPAVT